MSVNVYGSTLKWFAIATMFLDHLSAFILMPYFHVSYSFLDIDSYVIVLAMKDYPALFCLALRLIGRLAFPIFCFLLVEGIEHTHSKLLYLRNLIIAGIISEIPYNLCMTGTTEYIQGQNVMWTLAIGAALCAGIQFVEREKQPLAIKWAFIVSLTLIAMAIAKFCCTDYGAYGIFFIALLFILRKVRKIQCAVGGIVAMSQYATACFAFIPIYFYNGMRGRQMKWLFYAFYPAHLAALYFCRYFLLGY